MNHRDDPPEEPEVPECCGAEMHVDSEGNCMCLYCGKVEEAPTWIGPMDDGDLLGWADESVESKTRAMEMFRKFKKYHNDNPDVYRLFNIFAKEVIAAGKKNYSCRAIFHRIRWHTEIETRSGDGFKIGNNHSPYYGRLWEQRNPEHLGFFRKRKLTSQDKPERNNDSVVIEPAESEDWLDKELAAI